MSIRGTTLVFGILGDPVAHSLSPAMQNAAFAEAGIDAVYVPFHVVPADLGQAVEGIRALNVRGVNVTVPHKEAICPFLDRLDPQALRIGAVNTVICHDGKLTGFNTDATGFLRSLEDDLSWSPRGGRVLLIGAGGACRAALVALADTGARWIGIANRSEERAQGLVDRYRLEFPGTTFAHFGLDVGRLKGVLSEVDLVVNTSAVGLKGETFPGIPWGRLSPSALFYDMVYQRGGTETLRLLRLRGVRGADGLGMLASQGEEAFFLWTGRRPAPGLMRRTLEAALSR